MPNFIVKANSREDWYVVWSTISNSPLNWGTRSELEDGYRDTPEFVNPERFRRANINGTSMRDDNWFGWNDKIFLVGSNWELKRSDLKAFCEAIEVASDISDSSEALKYLTPTNKDSYF